MSESITLHNVYRATLCDLQEPQGSGASESDIARFWANVRKGARCWEWTGSRIGKNQYGQFTTADGQYAHRFSWALANGRPVPSGLSVLHHCDNPICVRPDHLFVGTHTDNMRDAARKGRLHVQRPKRHKVTDAEVEQIIARVSAGELLRVVAQAHGVSIAFASMLARGKRRQYRATTGAISPASESSGSRDQRECA